MGGVLVQAAMQSALFGRPAMRVDGNKSKKLITSTNLISRKTQRLSTNYLVVSETKIAKQMEALVSFEESRKSL